MEFTNRLRNNPEIAIFSVQKYDCIKVFKSFLFLNSLSEVSSSVKRKDCRTVNVNIYRTVIGLFVQMLCKSWRLLVEKGDFCRLFIAIARYMWYNKSKTRFLVLSKHSEGLWSVQQKKSMRTMRFQLTQAKSVGTQTFELPLAVDDASRYLS